MNTDGKKLDLYKYVKDGKLKNIILICGILGVALIFLSTLSGFEQEEKVVEYSVEEYKTQMEDSIKTILSKIEGVGQVEVLLTIESSTEGVYLENNSTKTKEIEPIIRGVVVVCQGGDDPVVVEKVLNAVTKALNVSSAKVCITKLNE